MNTPAKAPSIPSYHLVLYKRALHPELFPMRARRTVNHATYELEAWLMPGSHLLRFQHGELCCCELISDRDDNLPTTGAVATFPCAGERDFEHAFTAPRAAYLTTIQTETLNDSLYTSTYREMIDFAHETDALVHRWANSEGAPCLSLIDIQRYPREVHAQAYHLIAGGGLVLRTQSIFEHA